MAEDAEILEAIDTLSTHCRLPIMSVERRGAWMSDWCEDLASFPISDIRTIFADWRRSENPKFPTPGQALALLRAKARPQPAETRPRKAEPLSDYDYTSATLEQKLQHHLTAANEAEIQAATLWRRLPDTKAGSPPTFRVPEQYAGAEWAERAMQAKHHASQAKTIRELIARHPRIAAE